MALGVGIAILTGMAALLACLKTDNVVAQEAGGSSGVVPVYYPRSGLRTGQPQWHVAYYIHGGGTRFGATPFAMSGPPVNMARTPALKTGAPRTSATNVRTNAKIEQLVPPRVAR
jgi:hypothetical protein